MGTSITRNTEEINESNVWWEPKSWFIIGQIFNLEIYSFRDRLIIINLSIFSYRMVKFKFIWTPQNMRCTLLSGQMEYHKVRLSGQESNAFAAKL
jgi:hypothetical protein